MQILDFDHYWFITLLKKSCVPHCILTQQLITDVTGQTVMYPITDKIIKSRLWIQTLTVKQTTAFAGLQARPLAVPRRLQRTYSTYQLPHGFRQGTEHYDIRRTVPAGFRQGTEPSRRIIVDLNTGRMQEHISEMERRVGEYRFKPYEELMTLRIICLISAAYWLDGKTHIH